jgi:hypothetical protein
MNSKPCNPSAEALDDRHQLLFSNALYRLGEWIDLWQDCRSLQAAIHSESQAPWRAVYRHWRLGRLTPFLDRGLMLYSAFPPSPRSSSPRCCGFCWAGPMAAAQ